MSRPTVVFLCVHNAGRSQMAAAFARRYAGDRVSVLSGGSDPADHVHPGVVEAMSEVGIDLAGETPRRFRDEDLAGADVIVTMGCGEECPYVAGVRYLDWVVEDPAGRDVAHVRAIRDDLESRVRGLIDELLA